MAATYSSFMTTRYYSPVFNTALFDGPIRIYFSQSYESAALKVYHLLQTQHLDLWNDLRDMTLKSKEHIFLMMYPDQADLEMVFVDEKNNLVSSQEWEEGLAVGFSQPKDDKELNELLNGVVRSIQQWVRKTKVHEVSL